MATSPRPTSLKRWLRAIQTDNELKKNALICLRMGIVLARYFNFNKRKPTTMDYLCLLADGEKLKPAKKYRDSESRLIKSGVDSERTTAEKTRKKRREKAGKAIKLLELNNYVKVIRESGKRNKIKLLMPK